MCKYSNKVNGFCEKTNTIYEFDGCLWHGCDVCDTNRNPDSNLNDTHPKEKFHLQQFKKLPKRKNKHLIIN